MNFKPIKTEEDYNATLIKLEKIFDAEVNTKYGGDLEILGMLIEKYEVEKFPIGLPNPIEAIKFRMNS